MTPLSKKEMESIATAVVERMSSDVELLTVGETIELLRCSRPHLYNTFRRLAGFPQPFRYKGQRRTFWKRAEIVAWMEENLEPGTAMGNG